jgi:hypothetical protein
MVLLLVVALAAHRIAVRRQAPTVVNSPSA